ncbi:hypothetical protein FISHEDRAFT_40461 [Fistulina hepatica ATCC 64428]|uniref:Plus3 domain-containing protein n=1 Tax=Fistulina hepatica ATCC 64428 TaxID=1128425 RepID=A0A0D7AE49_9AGAR|nr:hypothetical protein FISHEDRAFT_40461 [Fistulina hepatica ATCC 64428]
MSDASGERIENLGASAGWESEDGQIDDDADKRSRLDDKSGQPDGDATAEFEDIMSIRLTRAMIARHYPVSWFEEYVKNTWVRYLVGSERNQRIYRLLRVQDVGPPLPKPYKIEEDHFADCGLKLAYGDEVKEFNMDRISDGPCEQSEFKRLSIYCASVKVKLPTKAEVRIKAKQMAELTSRPLTEVPLRIYVGRLLFLLICILCHRAT